MTDNEIWAWIKQKELKVASVARAIDVTEMSLNCYKSRDIPTKAKSRLIRFIQNYDQDAGVCNRDSVMLDKLLDYLGESHRELRIASREDVSNIKNLIK